MKVVVTEHCKGGMVEKYFIWGDTRPAVCSTIRHIKLNLGLLPQHDMPSSVFATSTWRGAAEHIKIDSYIITNRVEEGCAVEIVADDLEGSFVIKEVTIL